jgi:hypothetical protein
MSQVILNVDPSIAQKIDNIIHSFGSEEILVEKFIEFHQNKLKREIASLKNELALFETKFQMESSLFYSKFEAGQLGDDEDFMVWSGVYEMYLESQSKLEKLL